MWPETLHGSSGSIEGEFSIAVDDDSSLVSYDPIIEALRDPASREEAVEILIETCQGVIESEKDKKSGSAALKAITTAHSKLLEVDLSRASADTHGAMNKQLDAIIKKATELKGKLEKYKDAKAAEKWCPRRCQLR